MPPHYRDFFVFGCELGTVSPTGIRELLPFRWFPYFFGDEITLQIKIKPRPYLRSIIHKLDYKWKLLKVDSEEIEAEGDGTLTTFPYGIDMLSGFITLPRKLPLIQYILEMDIGFGDRTEPYWQQIFDFELHSGDKWLFGILAGIVLPLIGAILWEIIRRAWFNY